MSNRKKILLIITTVLITTLIATSVVIGLKYINSKTDTVQPISNTTATSKEEQARAALKDQDIDKAQALLKEAIEEHKASGDINAQVNAEAQLYMIQNNQTVVENTEPTLTDSEN